MLNERSAWQKACMAIGVCLGVVGGLVLMTTCGLAAADSLWTGFGNQSLLAETANMSQITGSGMSLGCTFLLPGWFLWMIGMGP